MRRTSKQQPGPDGGERVLILARDVIIDRDVVAGFRHGIDAILLFHQRIDKTPPNGGVIDLGVARKRGLGLRHHKWRTAHAFDATGNHNVGFAGLDGAGSGDHGIHARSAETVDRRAGYGYRQAGEEQRHARDIPVIFARLVGAAKDHVADRFPVDGSVSLHQCPKRYSAQIVRTDR